MSALVAGWLIDTFFWTGLLIAAVLLLRRPVARTFGAGVSYALWGLVLLRFVLPPLVLPPSMAPVEDMQVVTAASPMTDFAATTTTVTATTSSASEMALAWVEPLLLALWLGGAALFLAARVRAYRRMRAQLLAEARPVGEAGKVRLVETPAASGPVAFGVIDKVVALPPHFMAHYDRDARDLAIAHELAHHRGHDLLANMAAQGVLALHWFNPLAWLGWRAMRSDQEAACDARVMAGRTRAERAAYAQVIAGFARGQDFALAAPMACPMLGDKSIVHRLKSLTRGDCARSRRLAGVSALGLCAVALPLTASVSYASPPEPPAAPLPPEAPLAPFAPQPPAAPEAPPSVSFVPDVPTPPEVLFAAEDWGDLDAGVRADRAAALADRAEAQADALAARAEAQAERAAAAAEARAERAQALAQARAEARAAAVEARAVAQVVEESCDGDEPVSERKLADGRTVVRICQEAIARQASRGLEQARAEVARQQDLPSEVRQEILRDLDREIERVRNPSRVSAVSTAGGVRAVANAGGRAQVVASSASNRPVAFVSMPGAVTATVRFVASFAGQGEPQAFSVTVPVTFVPSGQAAKVARAEQTV